MGYTNKHEYKTSLKIPKVIVKNVIGRRSDNTMTISKKNVG
jgi:hypothetical protein